MMRQSLSSASIGRLKVGLRLSTGLYAFGIKCRSLLASMPPSGTNSGYHQKQPPLLSRFGSSMYSKFIVP